MCIRYSDTFLDYRWTTGGRAGKRYRFRKDTLRMLTLKKQTVLVQSACGGIGLAAIQICRMIGAEVRTPGLVHGSC